MQGTHSSGKSPADFTEPSKVASPFTHVTAEPSVVPHRRVSLKWIILPIITMLFVAGVAWGVNRLVSDPYRTLEPFPLETYVGNYHALEGSRFRANLRVENDLGYGTSTGRLMVFSIEGDGRTVAALVPTRLANNLFSRGQRYTAELQVSDGGLIQINSYAKN